MDEQYYQGDVLFIRIGEAKTRMVGVSPVPAMSGRHIIHEGEKTGHSHIVEAEQAELFRQLWNGKDVLIVEEQAEIRHEEHDPLVLPAGTYEIRYQREYVGPRISQQREREAMD